MASQTIFRSRIRRWISVLAVLVFAVRALLPTGYMLTEVHGQLSMVMCPAGLHHGGGTHHLSPMPPMDGMHHSAHDSLSTTHCPFALAGSVGLLAQAPAPAEPYFVLLRRPLAVAVVSVPVAPPLRHRAPRGPPSLA